MNKNDFWIKSKFRKKEGSDDLIVVFSPSKKMTYYRTDFPGSVLFMADQHSAYYTDGASRVTTIIKRLADRLRARRVLLLGPSKGGFASLMFARQLSHMDDTREYCALAFSPQTKVYPRNPNIPFPSYEQMIKRSRGDVSLLLSLRAFGDASSLRDVRAAIIFGAGNDDDRIEAHRLSGNRITLIPLPITGHSSSLPFLCDTTNREEVVEAVGKLAAAAKDQQDLALRQRSEVMIEELMTIPKMPNLSDLCRMVLDGKEKEIMYPPAPETPPFRAGLLENLLVKLSSRFRLGPVSDSVDERG